ncbi:MAG: RsmE family RNA methyltransferase [Bacteroidota bacterium]
MDAFIVTQQELEAGCLSTEESRHCALVLRKKSGDRVLLLDGTGTEVTAELTLVSKKECRYMVLQTKKWASIKSQLHLAIAPTKNMDRMEWMVEKLTEIGVGEISFIITENSERKTIRLDRLQKKMYAALKQSKNPFVPKLTSLIQFSDFISEADSDQKFIGDTQKETALLHEKLLQDQSATILIGPEGGFTKEEIKQANNANYDSFSMGQNILRTETAGFLAGCGFIIKNQ